MLRAHSFFWHYLWVAPNVLLLALSLQIWKRGQYKQFPAFFAFAVLSALGHLSVYAADILPSVTAETFWRVDWATLLIEGPIKFVLIAEIFAQVFGSYDSVARLGKLLIRGIGIALVFAAALAAAYAPKDSLFGIVSGAHLLDQTIYLIESGLLVFIFLFAAYFKLRPTRRQSLESHLVSASQRASTSQLGRSWPMAQCRILHASSSISSTWPPITSAS